MEWHVKDSMGIGKFLASSVLCVFCTLAIANPPSSEYPTYNAQYSDNPIRAITEYFRGRASFLDDDDKQLYVRSVMLALEQTQNGEIVEWWSKRNPANGRTRIISTYPTGSGYCRVYQTEVILNGNAQYFQERACIQGGLTGWQFYR
jgi:surface antigen